MYALRKESFLLKKKKIWVKDEILCGNQDEIGRGIGEVYEHGMFNYSFKV